VENREEYPMPRYAKSPISPIDKVEQEMSEPVSPERMELRRQLAADLRALRSRPVTEEEREFWRQFDEELEQEGLTFR
jgi:hypothetical protein